MMNNMHKIIKWIKLKKLKFKYDKCHYEYINKVKGENNV